MDDLDEFPIDVEDVLFNTDAEFKDRVLIPLQKIDAYTYVYLDDADSKIKRENWKTEHEKRVEQIMNTIKENKFIVEVDVSDAPNISGSYLAEWIRTNKNVTEFSIKFDRDDGIKDLTHAIQFDRTITTLNFGIYLQNDSCQTLIEAIRQNTTIRSLGIIEFDVDPKLLFEQVIALKKDIKELEFHTYRKKDPKVLKELENALKANTSLTSLHFYMKSEDFQQPDSTVLSGFCIPQKIKNVEFSFDPANSRTDNNIEENELILIKSITAMPHLEHVRVKFLRYNRSFSRDLATVLQESNANIQIAIQFLDQGGHSMVDEDIIHDTIKEILSWKQQQPQIEIMYMDAGPEEYYYDWDIFRKIRLTKLRIYDITKDNFIKLVQEFPNWNELEYFFFNFSDEILANEIMKQHDKLAAAISDNYSIKHVDILLNGDEFINEQAKKWIEQSLQRNQFLAECRASKGVIIPIELLPALVEFTNKNLNFLFDFVKAHVGQLFESTCNNKRKRCQMMSG